ncbi:ankyrin repeat-containing domain protein, partial [Pavlovales sp. CCMP2436]
ALTLASRGVEQADAYRNTALMLTSRGGHAACVSLLLERGAEVGQVNKDGQTALMLASQDGHAACVSLLFERGAEV